MTDEQKKRIEQEAKEYSERVATSGQFTSEECRQMAKDDYFAGAHFGYSLAEERIKELENALRDEILAKSIDEEIIEGLTNKKEK